MKPTVVNCSNGSPVRPSKSWLLPDSDRPPSARQLADIGLGRAVEHGRDRLETELRAGPAEVRLQNLAHVHTTGHAERIEHDLDGRAVGEEGHVFAGQNLGDHALVAVTAGHLVAHGNHPLGGNIDLDHLQYAAAEFVAALHRVELAVAGVEGRLDRRPLLLVELLQGRLPLRAADVERFDAEILGLLGHAAVLAAFDQPAAVFVFQFLLQQILDLQHEVAESGGNPFVALGLGFLERGFKSFPLVLGEAHAAGELLRVDDDAFHARGHFQRIVLHVFAGATEDGVQQFLFRA